MQDPYVVCIIGNEKKRGAAHNGGGKKPQWQDTFVFQAAGASLMNVQVWDKDTFSDDMVGEGTVNLNQLYGNPNRTENGTLRDYAEYVDLMRNGKSAGRVLLSM